VVRLASKSLPIPDVLVIGAGPAALAIGAALGQRGLAVEALSATEPDAPWPNTYGIWGEEVDALGLEHLLEHRWSDTVSYFGAGGQEGSELTRHVRDYGLFDKAALQRHGLLTCAAAGLRWRRGVAAQLAHDANGSTVTSNDGERLRARLVIDATGHEPLFVRRPLDGPVAGQAAYGIVGHFSAPPIAAGRFVLMDYRPDHLSEEERMGPPTFLYAMDLGCGRFFVEETSLALAPPLPFPVLRDRLHRRLAHRGVRVLEVEHEEFCLFPMNPALPTPGQRVVGFGGAASMVHPTSGYLVGALLRRAPALADAIAAALGGTSGEASDADALAAVAWEGLWPADLRRRHALYRFGLEKLMRFEEARLRHFFQTFFHLPNEQWYRFLTNTLPLPELVGAMLRLFGTAPGDVRWGLMEPKGRELALLGRMLRA
jgi:lycopene cyclase-like protein